MYIALPENGFTSKILSSQKKEKKYMPQTPSKLNKKAFRPPIPGGPVAGKLNLANRFGFTHATTTPPQKNGVEDDDQIDIYSQVANLLKFSE